MEHLAAPTEWRCEIARVEYLDDGSPRHTSLVNPAYTRSVRFATVAEALEAASLDARKFETGTDYKVWPNGWETGEPATRYRFLPTGKPASIVA